MRLISLMRRKQHFAEEEWTDPRPAEVRVEDRHLRAADRCRDRDRQASRQDPRHREPDLRHPRPEDPHRREPDLQHLRPEDPHRREPDQQHPRPEDPHRREPDLQHPRPEDPHRK